jgi:hypothetical protein
MRTKRALYESFRALPEKARMRGFDIDQIPSKLGELVGRIRCRIEVSCQIKQHDLGIARRSDCEHVLVAHQNSVAGLSRQAVERHVTTESLRQSWIQRQQCVLKQAIKTSSGYTGRNVNVNSNHATKKRISDND